MKKVAVLGAVLVFIGLFVLGCGQQETGGGSRNPTVPASELFDVSGAKAIATASSSTATGSAMKAFQAANVTELLKLNASNEISSVLAEVFEKKWHPPISVIETGPDGSLYIGFQWGIWIRTDTSTTDSSAEKDVAFFKVSTSGAVEIVDDNIYGVGSWYGGSENGELPVKQVQFDADGNLYYIGKNSSGSTNLWKKTAGGTISQIGSDRYEVRDFLVTPGGLVFFHGSNSGNWSIEWLRVISGSTVNNIFYNDGGGWLRAYYYYNDNTSDTNYVFLVGENLTLLDEDEIPQKYSGIIRVSLSSTGAPVTVEALYDDKNMYSNDYGTIGGQLTWGYWDPAAMEDKKFFDYDDYNEIILPLSLEAGVTEASIRAFIRAKFQSTTTDNLDSVTFAGITTTETWPDKWQINYRLDDLVSDNISGTTWSKWRQDNDLQGVSFGNAKQLVFTDSKVLYAVLSLDNWGSGTSKGDKLFQVVNSTGEAKIIAFPQDTTNYYKPMSKVRVYGDYAVYLSNKVGNYKILRLDLTDPTAAPIDMIPDKNNIEIFSFNYNSDTGMLLYDVYDLDTNTSYLAEQAITSTTVGAEISAEGYTITDVVPFEVSE